MIVSIVVFYCKRFHAVSPTPTAPLLRSERMLVTVEHGPYRHGRGPLTDRHGRRRRAVDRHGQLCELDADEQQAYFNVKAGQWIMLSQAPAGAQCFPSSTPRRSSPPAANRRSAHYTPFWYRWYKVVAPARSRRTARPARRIIATSRCRAPTGIPSNGAARPAVTTYASIFDGVVAVYEKEMELEQVGAPWALVLRGRLQATDHEVYEGIGSAVSRDCPSHGLSLVASSLQEAQPCRTELKCGREVEFFRHAFRSGSSARIDKR